MNNNGIQNEIDIINVLNGKRMGKLPLFWRSFVASIYPNESLNEVVSCYKAEPNMKEDIVLNVNNHVIKVSIKSGTGISVHGESLNRFCGFLKWLGISDESIDTLKLYHYGDGTKDGTGTIRLATKELVKKYKNEIKKFNDEINHGDKLFRIMLRFIKLGTPNQYSSADYIYYGDVNGGIYADTYWLLNYLNKINYDDIKEPHFGPFIYDNASRDLTFKNTNEVKEKDNRRHYCNIKWPSIKEDIMDFRENRYKKDLLEKGKNISKK